MNIKKPIKYTAISPIVATILLVVIAVIMVIMIISWSRNFSNDSLNKTQDFGKLKSADASSFVYSKSYSEGTMQFTYSPPESIKSEEIIITHYQILELPKVEPIPLTAPYTLRESTNILPLNCLYEYSLPSPDFTIQLITNKNTYITIKQRDQKMVCTSGGTGTVADPIIVCNAEDLNGIRTDLDANYSLGKDIDLQCFSRQREDGFQPIGSCGPEEACWADDFNYVFSGSFDGQNYSISNLYINRPEETYIGLFGATTSAEIKDLKLVDVNVTGNTLVGGLVGQPMSNENYPVFSNISVTGSVTGKGYSSIEPIGSNHVGGLIGYASNVNITDSFTNCSVNGIGDENREIYSNSTGGFIGTLDSGEISNSYSLGSVSGMYTVGGFIGYNTGTISNSYSKGSVNGIENVGGFASYNTKMGEIINSYSTGTVIGESKVGGFVANMSSGLILNSYSVGLVDANGKYVGGFSGYVSSRDTEISGCYWDKDTSQQESSNGDEEGKTTEEMKQRDTFVDWDFDAVWDITENVTYPFFNLREEPIDETLILSFSLPEYEGNRYEIIITIDSDNNTIIVSISCPSICKAPSTIGPIIEISNNATVSPESGTLIMTKELSGKVYTVTAGNLTREYIIKETTK